MRKMLEEKLARFEELERLMVDPDVLTTGGARYSAIAREHGSLAKLVNKFREFKSLNQQMADTKAMMLEGDLELKEMAEAELPELHAKREKCWDELLGMTSAGDDAFRTRCGMESRAGKGGDEAAIFARDLYEMYKHYLERRGWRVELMEMNATELGGFKEVILGIEGEGCFQALRFESGGHRVQRVPETEAKGRVHTSAATVAVMAEPEDIEVDLQTSDYKIDKFCASGPGGQHVNKTESAIRLTHHESGIVVSMQDEKSQHKNLAKALRILKTRIYELKQREAAQKRSDTRKSLVGSGDRSERIRTYNFPENRLTDHRINLTLYKLDQIIAGHLEPVIDALIEYDRQQYRNVEDMIA